MTPLHFYYQTRWAVRNDPVLGFICCGILAACLGWHETIREARRTIRREAIAVARERACDSRRPHVVGLPVLGRKRQLELT
jgi:hypothetical protein